MKKLIVAYAALFSTATLPCHPCRHPEAKVAEIARAVDAARMKATVESWSASARPYAVVAD